MAPKEIYVESHVPYYQSPLLVSSNIVHGFWGRKGGVSSFPFNTLNVGKHNGDAEDCVMQNRSFILAQTGCHALSLTKQVHGAKVVWVDEPLVGNIEADGMVTRTPGIALGVMTADCLPLLMWHPASQTVAAVHSGWKGTVAGIAQEALRVMDVAVHEVKVAIGPCIWQVSYEVGQDVWDAAQSPDFFLAHPNEEKKYFYDLPGHMLHQLKQAGIKDISLSPANTYDLPDEYFSFRRKTHLGEPACGNQLSLIGIMDR